MAQLPVVWILSVLALLLPSHCGVLAGLARRADRNLDFGSFELRDSRASSTLAAKVVHAPACSPDVVEVPVEQNATVSFTSPNFPNKYPKTTTCGWIFVAADDSVLELHCPYISIQNDDFFDLTDVDWEIFNYLDNVNQKQLYHHFWGKKAKMAFESNGKGESRGFQCYVWAIEGKNLQPTVA